MEKRFIMTAFGKDRPGIVADVTEVIFENGCKVEDSTMTRLADEFTLVLLLTGQGDDLENTLSKECRRLDIEKGLSAFIRPIGGDPPEAVAGRRGTIHVQGLDQAGIIFKISRYLAENGVNIEHLNSRKSFSPESGAALYTVEIEVTIPDALETRAFDKGLERIGDELSLDVTLN
jgi:glycine cleavage system transcriptional repressor